MESREANPLNRLPNEFFQTAKRFHSLFSVEREMKLDLLRQLLSHGALGELEAAEKIWKKYPDLLTWRGTIYHPNQSYTLRGKDFRVTPIRLDQSPGRPGYENRTYWQTLIMNEEFKEAEAVGKYMSDEEREKQFAEIFPDGKIVKYGWDLEHAKKLLNAAFNAITKDITISYDTDVDDGYLLEGWYMGHCRPKKMDDATQEALKVLYEYAKPNPKHNIGLVGDANFYIESLKYYDEDVTFKKFRTWSQQVFWNRHVEEWLAGSLGTVYLRSHAQGIGNDRETRKGCIMANRSSYFAFRRPHHSMPSVNFFVGYHGALWQRRADGPGETRSRADNAYRSRMQSQVTRNRELGQALCRDMQRVQKCQRF